MTLTADQLRELEEARTLTLEEWKQEFQELNDNIPDEGDLLYTSDGSLAKLNVELTSGKEPFIFGRAYVPKTVGDKLGWFIHGESSESIYGLKIILLPKSKQEIIDRLGLLTSQILVKSVLVVRRSVSGHSLLGEVHEWE